MVGQKQNRKEILVDNIFKYNVTLNIMNESENLEPKIVEECCNRMVDQNGKMQS